MVELHGQWGPKVRTTVRRSWMGLLGRSSWFPGAEVDGAEDGSYSHRIWHGFTWLLSLPMSGLMQTSLPTAYTVLPPIDGRLGR
jgi:hypothetical protein